MALLLFSTPNDDHLLGGACTALLGGLFSRSIREQIKILMFQMRHKFYLLRSLSSGY